MSNSTSVSILRMGLFWNWPNDPSFANEKEATGSETIYEDGVTTSKNSWVIYSKYLDNPRQPHSKWPNCAKIKKEWNLLTLSLLAASLFFRVRENKSEQRERKARGLGVWRQTKWAKRSLVPTPTPLEAIALCCNSNGKVVNCDFTWTNGMESSYFVLFQPEILVAWHSSKWTNLDLAANH